MRFALALILLDAIGSIRCHFNTKSIRFLEARSRHVFPFRRQKLLGRRSSLIPSFRLIVAAQEPEIEKGSWNYRFSDDSPYPAVAIRREPLVDAQKVGPIIAAQSAGTILISGRVMDSEGRIYLRLADNTGWICATDPRDATRSILTEITEAPVENSLDTGKKNETMEDPADRFNRSLDQYLEFQVAAVASGLNFKDSKRETLKKKLLDSIETLEMGNECRYGIGLNSKRRQEFMDIIQDLISYNPVQIPASSPLSNGMWKLIYTTAEDRFTLTPDWMTNIGINIIGDVEQKIDVDKRQYTTMIKYKPFCSGNLQSEWDESEFPNILKVRFIRYQFKIFNDGLNTEDKELDVEDEDNIGSLEILYLDKNLRIVKSIKNHETFSPMYIFIRQR